MIGERTGDWLLEGREAGEGADWVPETAVSSLLTSGILARR